VAGRRTSLRHLKGDEGAGKRLTQAGLRPYLKGKINQVEVLAK